jgi:hypothetical protein
MTGGAVVMIIVIAFALVVIAVPIPAAVAIPGGLARGRNLKGGKGGVI